MTWTGLTLESRIIIDHILGETIQKPMLHCTRAKSQKQSTNPTRKANACSNANQYQCQPTKPTSQVKKKKKGEKQNKNVKVMHVACV